MLSFKQITYIIIADSRLVCFNHISLEFKKGARLTAPAPIMSKYMLVEMKKNSHYAATS